MRIVVLSQYYDPEPVPIPGQIARHLHEQGHEVRVLTGLPNYPAGELYPSYENASTVQVQDGIPVHRVKSFLSHSDSAVGRFASYGSFALAAATRLRMLREADVVYVYATQMTASVPALLASAGAAGTPYVLHIQDLWPESVTESSMVPERVGSAVAAGMAPWLNLTYRRAAAVVGIAPTMVRTLSERAGDDSRLHMVYNFSRSEGAAARTPSTGDRTGTLKLLYAGNLGDLQDLETVARAVRAASAESEVVWRIAGSGSAEERLRSECADLVAAGVVEFLGRLEPDDLTPHIEWADFQLVPLRDLEIFRGTIPSKLQGSLAAGVPVITTVAGDVSDIVGQQRLGYTACPEDADDLQRTILRAAASTAEERALMSRNAIDFYNDSMSEAAGLGRIEEILTDAAEQAADSMNRSTR